MNIGREAIDGCGLEDLGFVGYPFTWSNGRIGIDNIQARLDRTLSNPELINRFSHLQVSHLPRFRSDHAALLIHLEVPQINASRRGPNIFMFEESWSQEEKCERIIRDHWNNHGVPVPEKIRLLRCMGSEFDDHNLGKIKKDIKRIENHLNNPSLWSGSAGIFRNISFWNPNMGSSSRHNKPRGDSVAELFG